jgi:hypothetical protein
MPTRRGASATSPGSLRMASVAITTSASISAISGSSASSGIQRRGLGDRTWSAIRR